jgi:effector-binding domain-containing protein
MEYQVRLEQVSSRPVAVVRRRASVQELARVVPEACGTVWSVVRAQQIPGAGWHVALYWDVQINLEVGVELQTPFGECGEVVGSATPAGSVATAEHFGPYNRLAEAHQAIRAWCASHGHALAGPNWEIYDHWQDEWNQDPAKIRTEVFYLVKTGGLANRLRRDRSPLRAMLKARLDSALRCLLLPSDRRVPLCGVLARQPLAACPSAA